MSDRGDGEARADVARRVDSNRGPTSYEIGSEDDPDRTDDDA
jgi:GTPase